MTEDQDEKILKKRAATMAVPLAAKNKKESSMSFLEFRLGQESYAISTDYVSEVVGTTHLTPLPSVPPFIVGILSVRGRIWSVMDLREFFNIPKQGISDHPRAILVETDDLRFGILADSNLRILNPESLRPPPEVTERIPHNMVIGTIDTITIVLDLPTMAKDPRLIIRENVE